MSLEPSFQELMVRLRGGDKEAEYAIFDRFSTRLIIEARQKLDRDKRLRAKLDPEDVVQSVFRSFFLRHADGQWELKDWESVWSLLVVITLHKCGHKLRDFRRAGRDVAKEWSPASEDSSSWDAIARDPSPSEVAMFTETVTTVLAGLKGSDRQVMELRLQGYTVPEISKQIGRTEFTVDGLLRRIRKKLQHLREEGLAEE